MDCGKSPTPACELGAGKGGDDSNRYSGNLARKPRPGVQGDQPDGHDPVVGDAEAGALLVCTHRLLATASGELSSGGIRVRRPLASFASGSHGMRGARQPRRDGPAKPLSSSEARGGLPRRRVGYHQRGTVSSTGRARDPIVRWRGSRGYPTTKSLWCLRTCAQWSSPPSDTDTMHTDDVSPVSAGTACQAGQRLDPATALG